MITPPSSLGFYTSNPKVHILQQFGKIATVVESSWFQVSGLGPGAVIREVSSRQAFSMGTLIAFYCGTSIGE